MTYYIASSRRIGRYSDGQARDSDATLRLGCFSDGLRRDRAELSIEGELRAA